MGLTIGLTYNLKSDFPISSGSPVGDDAAECESQQTVDAIIAGLEAGGHKVIPLAFTHSLPGKLQSTRLDLVFNIAEGWCGRNRESLVPAMLEFFGIPHTGSDPLTLGIALDKSLSKTVLAQHGIPSARWKVVEHPSQWRDADLSFPLFVKPNEEGSSKGIRSQSRVEDADALQAQLQWIYDNYRQAALIEEFIPGREFSVGIVGNRNPVIFPVMEVIPAGQILPLESFVYSFEVKSCNLETLVCPAPVEQLLESQLRLLALQAYQGLNCRDLSRVDFRLDQQGHPMFLEINPLPGLSEVSLFPLQAKAAGIEFSQLLNMIVASALERYPNICGGHSREEVALG